MRLHAKATSAASTQRRTGIAAALAVTLFLLLTAASAQAATPTRFSVPTLSQSLPGELSCGTAVDSAGNLYVGNYEKVKIFDQSGVELTNFSVEACEVAVDSAGNVYTSKVGGEVSKFNPTSFPPTGATTYSLDTSVNGTGILESGPGRSVAVDPATDEVYVTRGGAAAGGKISAYQPDGTLIDDTIGSGVAGARYGGVDVFGANGHIYAWDKTSRDILIFDPSVSLTVPAKTIDDASTPAGSMGGSISNNFLAIAVDQSNGNVFAIDEEHLLVNEFKPSGELVSQIDKDFEGNAFESAEPSSLAVDNSEGANDGTLYVSTKGKVSAYGLKGHPPIPALSQSLPGELSCGTAVDSAGNLYVGNYEKVKIFDQSGVELTNFSVEACEVAVDSAGNVYTSKVGGEVSKFNPTSFPPTGATTYSLDTSVNGTGILESGPGRSVAVDPATDEVYVTRGGAAAGGKISAYQPDGTLIDDTIGSGVAGARYGGVDVFGANGHIYAWDKTSRDILIFDPSVSLTVPAKTIDDASTPAGSMGGSISNNFLAIAVDQSNGNVFAIDEEHLLVNEFKPSGELVSQIDKDFEGNAFESAEPSSLAVDNSGGANDGTLYVSTLGKVSAYGPLPATGAKLKVKKDGKGTGTITSDPAGIDCGATCQAEFANGTEMTLTAVADPGSTFKQWSGCDSVVGAQCKVKMIADKEVTAIFTGRKLTVEKPPSGSGTVTSAPAGIDCGATCEAEFANGAAVTLTAVPGLGSVIKWSGCDSVSIDNKCTLAMNADRKVIAIFAAKPTITNQAVKAHDTSAKLEASLDPESEETTYRFQYVDQASFEAEGYLGAASAPVPAAKLPADAVPVAIFTVVEGLSAGTTYHFRLVAFNSVGESVGPDQTFTTHLTPTPGLPGGRVYEQASPVHKNGLDALGTSGTVRATPSGDGITFVTHSGIPGGEGAPGLPLNLARRGAEGWSTQGIMPPNSEGESADVIGWTPDLSHVLSQARRFLDSGGTKTLLDSSTAESSLTTIVPHTVLGDERNYYFAGTSADGSKVFFESDGAALADGAVPGKDNLYVWDRESEEITLVGVLPDLACGSPPCPAPEGSFAGPYDWVNGEKALDLGGAKRDYYTQDEHAISDDGERVFFTAGGTGRIYLRTDPAGPDAETVEISTSEKENGAGPGDTDGAGTRPKAFMGATPDGSSAFFTSAEKLTDDADTGPEPDGFPAVARADIDGDPTDMGFLPASSNGPGGVTIEGTHIYWVDAGEGNPGEGKIGRAQLNDDGDATEIEPNFIEGASNPNGVAVGEGFIYWTNAGDEEDGTGTIGRADINGTPASVDQDCVTGASNPQGIAVGGGFIYWGNNSADNSEFQSKRGIGRAELDCGDVKQAFVPGTLNFPRAIALNGTHLYWTGYVLNGFGKPGFSRISRANLDGSGFIPNFIEVSPDTETREPEGIALNSTHLFWAQRATDTIGRATLDGNKDEVNREFITDAGQPQGLALDGSHLYWATNQEVLPNLGNDLYRYDEEVDEDGNHLTDISFADGTVAPGTNPNGAEVRGVLGASSDGSRVYFAANGVLTTTPNERGESATLGNCPEDPGKPSGTCNVYLADGDEVDFIARVAGGEADNWVGTPTGVEGSGRVDKAAQVAPGGGTLLFRSGRQLSDYDNKGRSKLYRYSAAEGELGCVSCDPSGTPPTNAPVKSVRTATLTPNDPASTLLRALSDSGDQVFFESTDALVAADTNGDDGCPIVGSDLQEFSACQDVYMWEAQGSGSCESDQQGGGCLYLLSTGKSPYPSFLADASLSGDDVFFFTRDQLVGQDTDQLYDVYDARVNGGLASQNEAPPAPCEGEACKPGASTPPGSNSAGSAAFSGPGNPKADNKPRRPRCAKGKRRVRRNGKARCVKRQHRGKQQRDANTTGRAGR